MKLVNDGASTVHFGLLADEVLTKKCDNTKPTESSKNDEVEEDDVFSSNERQTHHNSQSEPNTHQPNQLTPVITNNQINTVTTEINSTSSVGVVVINNPSSVAPIFQTPVTSTTSTTRRPSYTSKAPSALTNLPKTIEDIEHSPASLQPFNLNDDGSLPSEEENHEQIEHSDSVSVHSKSSVSSKDLLSLHNQASFESLDDYSNPGTPTANVEETPANSGNFSHPMPGVPLHLKRERGTKLRADALSRSRWEAAAKADVLTVRCRDKIGELHKSKFGSGSKGKSIKV